jgi:hypothetical protein
MGKRGDLTAYFLKAGVAAVWIDAKHYELNAAFKAARGL